MSHNIQAVIGPTSALNGLAKRFQHATCIAAPQGFAILPVSTPSFLGELGESGLNMSEDFPSHLVNVIESASLRASLALVQTEYFGGTGWQGAGVIAEGKWLMPWSVRSTEDAGPDLWPINAALTQIGVRRDGELDEFDSLGLGRYRSFEGLE